jgi:hypothetical protein
MKKYREAKTIFGKVIPDTMILEVDGSPPKIIKKETNPEEWAEYEKTLSPKKTRKKK